MLSGEGKGPLEKDMLDRMLGFSGQSPETIAANEGIVICESADMPARFDDCIIFKTIFLPINISADERLGRIAHCLGHYFMHSDNLWGWGKMWCRDNKTTREYKYEFEADCFAAFLISHMEQ